MLILKKNIEVRKELVDKIAELTGIRSFYTRAPLYAYEIGPYTVDREGNLLVKEEAADWNILNELLGENMVLPAENIEDTFVGEEQETETQETEVQEAEEQEAQPTAQSANQSRVMVIRRNTPNGSGTEQQYEVPTRTEQTRSIFDFSPAERVSALESLFSGVETAMEEAEEPDAVMDSEDTDESEITGEMEQSREESILPETAETPETVCGAVSEEEQNTEVESDVAAEEAEIPVADTADNETVVRISLPTTRHNGLTIKNLMHMLYTRGELMGKATGGTFDVKEEFIRRLDIEEPKTIEEFLNLTGAFQEDTQESPFEGIEFTQEQITFTGFPDGIAEDLLDTCIKLTALINKTAIESRSVQAKQVTVENERYTFRVWLLHLGMKGREYGMARKILMRNLTGHTAFRTEADAEKAKLRAERVKAQLAAAKAEHEAESVQSDDASEGQLGQTVEVASEETAEG